MKFCFVILHYRTDLDTIDCINSILKINGKFDIVIVDNASNNGSIENVENEFKAYKNIYIVKNEKNLGFADGNNIGYQFAKKQLMANMIAVLNNDVLVDTIDLIDRIVQLYNETNFMVAGPDIESMEDHGHQNPMNEISLDKNSINFEIFKYNLLLLINYLNLFDVMKKMKKKEVKNIQKKSETRKFDVTLHGAFVIFSPDFIECEENCFRKGTFLYMEEAILYQYCKKKALVKN